jgi:hypothetical protein
MGEYLEWRACLVEHGARLEQQLPGPYEHLYTLGNKSRADLCIASGRVRFMDMVPAYPSRAGRCQDLAQLFKTVAAPQHKRGTACGQLGGEHSKRPMQPPARRWTVTQRTCTILYVDWNDG